MRPTTSVETRKMPSLPSVIPTSAMCSPPVVAIPESSAIIATARMSSMMRMPKINCANRSLVFPSSPSALTMMVVEEMERIAPRKMLSIVPQPNTRPIS